MSGDEVGGDVEAVDLAVDDLLAHHFGVVRLIGLRVEADVEGGGSAAGVEGAGEEGHERDETEEGGHGGY